MDIRSVFDLKHLMRAHQSIVVFVAMAYAQSLALSLVIGLTGGYESRWIGLGYLSMLIPAIWRRIQVPNTILLCCLHDALQAVLGWTDSHLHQFEKDSTYWGVPDDDELEDDVEVIDESKVAVGKVLKAEGDSIIYLYDFGDNWRHEVVLDKILPASAISTRPVCLAGERRCPPEEVGGTSGYSEFLPELT